MYIEGTEICDICYKRINSVIAHYLPDAILCSACYDEIMPMILKLYEYYKNNNINFTFMQKMRLTNVEKIVYTRYINDIKNKESEQFYNKERRKIIRKLIDKYEKINF